jgi:hypothetical protein
MVKPRLDDSRASIEYSGEYSGDDGISYGRWGSQGDQGMGPSEDGARFRTGPHSKQRSPPEYHG